MTDLFSGDGGAAESAPPSDWTRGYAIDRLKALAAPFAAAKPYVFGAFGYARERDVATALSAGRWFADHPERPVVAAISRVAKVGSRRADFRGQPVAIPAGDAVAWDLGLLYGASISALRLVLDAGWPATAPAQWVEWFEEDDRKWMLERLGFSYCATRIAAGSEIKGLYVRGRADSDVRLRLSAVSDTALEDRAAIACLSEDFITPDEQAAILAEVSGAPWAQHYSSYNKRHSWTAVALRGYVADDPGFIIKPSEMSESWKQDNPALAGTSAEWTTLADHCPTARAVVLRVCADRLDRVRLMRLAESGELTRHADITDRDAGTADGKVARLHIPLATMSSCVVSSWGVRGKRYGAHFQERSLCYLDQRRPHAVRNPESIDRIHLVIDAYANDAIRERFSRAAWRCND